MFTLAIQIAKLSYLSCIQRNKPIKCSTMAASEKIPYNSGWIVLYAGLARPYSTIYKDTTGKDTIDMSKQYSKYKKPHLFGCGWWIRFSISLY